MRAAPAALFAAAFSASCAASGEGGDHDFAKPSSSTARLGLFAAGLALADLDGDGDRDLIAANGSDWSAQPLTAYRAEEAQFSEYPAWYSQTIGHRQGLAAGDVDGDGRIDLAAGIHFDRQRSIEGGGFELYFDGLNSPPHTHTIGAQVVNLALGDVDQDGDLDLALAVLQEKDGTPGRPRIYRNHGGRFDPDPLWVGAPNGAADLRLTDVDGDGHYDLAFAGQKIEVYYGRQKTAPFAPEPDWVSSDESPFSLSIDVAPATEFPRRIAAGRNCPPAGAKSCRPKIALYQPARSDDPFWQFDGFGPGEQPLETIFGATQNEIISGALTLDLNKRSLVTSARIYRFGGGGRLPEPIAEHRTEFVAQELRPVNLREPCILTKNMTLSITERRAVITLPERVTERVRRLEIDGRPLARWSKDLNSRTHAWTVGSDENSLTISPAVEPGDKISVEYDAGTHFDLILADGDPRLGNHVFFNRRPCEAGGEHAPSN